MIKRMFYKRPIRSTWRTALVVILLGVLLVNFMRANVISAIIQPYPVTVTRTLPASVTPGQTFNVMITFTSPADNFNSLGLSDFAPAGWTMVVNNSWNTPISDANNITGNHIDYVWYGPYAKGTSFKAVYQVTVPTSAAPGTYSFTNVSPAPHLEYYVGAGNSNSNITGQSQTSIVNPSAAGSTNVSSAGGGGGSAATTPAPTPTPTPTPTATPTLKPGITNLAGNIDASGTFTQTVTAPSGDGQAKVTMNSGSKALDANRIPLTAISIDLLPVPPAVPSGANIIGSAYNFEPSGATFSSPVTITFRYNPAQLSPGTDPKNLYLAWFDVANNKWVNLTSTVDTLTYTVTAQVTHFTGFAVIGTPVKPTVTSTPVITSPSIASQPVISPNTSMAPSASNSIAQPSTSNTPSPVPTPNDQNQSPGWVIIVSIIIVAIAVLIVWRVTSRPRNSK